MDGNDLVDWSQTSLNTRDIAAVEWTRTRFSHRCICRIVSNRFLADKNGFPGIAAYHATKALVWGYYYQWNVFLLNTGNYSRCFAMMMPSEVSLWFMWQNVPTRLFAVTCCADGNWTRGLNLGSEKSFMMGHKCWKKNKCNCRSTLWWLTGAKIILENRVLMFTPLWAVRVYKNNRMLAGKHLHMVTNALLLLYDCIYIWRSMLGLMSSPLKPGKPTGTIRRERERERKREDQSKQQRNALHHLELLLSTLPLACHVMRNYSTIKVPAPVTVYVGVRAPRGAWWPHSTMSTVRPGRNRQFHTSESGSEIMQGRVDIKGKHVYLTCQFTQLKGKISCSAAYTLCIQHFFRIPAKCFRSVFSNSLDCVNHFCCLTLPLSDHRNAGRLSLHYYLCHA